MDNNMNIRIFRLSFSLSICTLLALAAAPSAIEDPIHVFAVFHGLGAGRIIYKWILDLNHDGKKEILLAAKPTQAELQEDERESNGDPQISNECDFAVYIPDHNGYYESKGLEEDGGIAAAAIAINVNRCFVGKIKQLNRWGIVTIDVEPEGRRNPAVATINAYTLEGDYLKVTVLAKYDPDKVHNNPIYNEYLSETKRTKVQLQEITVGK